MATQIISRSFLHRQTIFSLLSRSVTPLPTPPLISRSFTLIRPLSAAVHFPLPSSSIASTRSLSTRATRSSLNDPSPNWSNRPPKETILLDGCDFEHWLVVMEPPVGDPTRDEIIDSYIKTLAAVVGSEEEARMKIYSVSHRCYFAFGALVSEELSYKIKELPRVRWVLPDSYLDVKNKNYGGEPFIDGKAVPYDPKYHEEWIRNNARANERNKRPRNPDRRTTTTYDRRREGMQNRDFQNTTPPMGNQSFQNSQSNMGMPNQGMQNTPSNMAGMPQSNMGRPGGPPPPPPNNYMGGPSPPPPNNFRGEQPPPLPNNYMGGPPPPPPNNFMGGPPHSPPNNFMGGPPPPNKFMDGPPPQLPNNYLGRPQNMGGMPQNNMGSMPPNNMGGMPQNNMGSMPPNNAGGFQPNAGWSNNMGGNMQQNYQNVPSNEGISPQGAPSNYPNYNSNRDEDAPVRKFYSA
ncbi:multiple organellar RNA editing factor 8, chloroplastic/mitochondrial-like [Mercurialis annua]|uniref:multiple organellar RNA editing factor 8, chloroplastic/mitochondrial-like n=1 Tax=Mercurialis annua TaxID=3986 RepID=UPI002160614E|nr:multiple organellar RNA editing factor 8, chloroplastic/mitochondrial-like [Mercurialis annua]